MSDCKHKTTDGKFWVENNYCVDCGADFRQVMIEELEAKLKESEDTGLKWYKRYTAAFEKYGVPEEVGEELIKTKAKVTELESQLKASEANVAWLKQQCYILAHCEGRMVVEEDKDYKDEFMKHLNEALKEKSNDEKS
jgi:hypothetical protein